MFTLFVVKERLVGLKHNTGFGGRGWGYTRVGDCYVHCPKRGHFIEVSQHFCPSLQFWIYFENKESGTHPVIHIKAIIACHTLKSHYCQTVEELLSYWYYRRNIIFYFIVLLTIRAARTAWILFRLFRLCFRVLLQGLLQTLQK